MNSLSNNFFVLNNGNILHLKKQKYVETRMICTNKMNFFLKLARKDVAIEFYNYHAGNIRGISYARGDLCLIQRRGSYIRRNRARSSADWSGRRENEPGTHSAPKKKKKKIRKIQECVTSKIKRQFTSDISRV